MVDVELPGTAAIGFAVSQLAVGVVLGSWRIKTCPPTVTSRSVAAAQEIVAVVSVSGAMPSPVTLAGGAPVPTTAKVKVAAVTLVTLKGLIE